MPDDIFRPTADDIWRDTVDDEWIIFNETFESTGYDEYWRGSEEITNGTFDADSDWAKGVGWDIGVTHSGKAHCDGSQIAISSLSQGTSLSAGSTYRVIFTVSNYSAGQVRAGISGPNYGTYRSANGTYEEINCWFPWFILYSC